MDNITLIEANPKDIPKLIYLEKDAVNEKVYSAALTEEDWLGEFKNGKIFFIKYNEKIVGNLSYEMRNCNEVYISGVLVLKSHQGKGIAKSALIDLLNKYPGCNFDLVTHPNNSAIFLYQNLGFKIVERIENYFDDGEPRLKLQLSREL